MAESHPSAADPAALAAQARQALAFFEAALADRGVLIHLDEDLRRRLLEAAGRVARPDPWQKREFLREARRQHKEQKRAEDERKLSSTGIRKLRREEVFLTPPLLPAPVAPGGDIDAELATPAAAPASPIRAEAADVDAQLANPPAARAPRIRATAADDDDDGAAVADAATAPNAAADAAAAGPAAAPAAPHVVRDERNCYVCKTTFTELHHFYDSLCQRCGDFHFGKRHQTADLRGRVAVVTGARVKIGYQASILLLRAGCRVVATTRFPHDAALRYSREADFAAWRDRLHVHGLDLRHTPSVEAFCHHLDRTLDRLDFLISNACQTVRRPSGFYQHLMDQERAPISALPPGAQQVLRSHEALRLQPAGGDGGGAQSLPVLIEALRQHDAPELSQRPLLAEDLARSGALF
ncbi:MAG: SDR family oxidoreductase, partial [Planctomycetes bacterium]|nr:SDR family oxidoreductase [Planctomycetota bacterium]